MISILEKGNNEARNLKSEKSKDYTRKPQQNRTVMNSNGNASETKANKSFDNSVFFDIEAKRTPSLERKIFSKRSEHIR
jgi:hypothetical protein